MFVEYDKVSLCIEALVDDGLSQVHYLCMKVQISQLGGCVVLYSQVAELVYAKVGLLPDLILQVRILS